MKHNFETVKLLHSWVNFAPQNLDSISKLAWVEEGEKLLTHWQLEPRKYHNIKHLSASINAFYEAKPERYNNPTALFFAIWYHDAVYFPWKSDNEEMSAKWAVESLTKFNFDKTTISEVEGHILATKTHIGKDHTDQWDMLDIDLLVLSYDENAYDQYEKEIREEYIFVEEKTFKEGRKNIKRALLML